MVGKCANPDCSTPFKYFRDGRLFLIELKQGSGNNMGSSFAEHAGPLHYFWLCSDCCRKLTLVPDQERGVRLVPIPSKHKDLGSAA